MKRFFITLTIMILITIAPFVSIVVYGESQKPAYNQTFLGELGPKFNRLKNEKERKIILIGGSSLPFGVRSDYLEEALGYKVINFGLYASLGTTMMMELSKVNIQEGDIVVLAPEVSKQTYDVYFDPTAALQALETNKDMKKYLSIDEQMDLFYNYFSFIQEKSDVLKNGIDYEALGVYTINSFNEYGDIIYPRKTNIMSQCVDSLGSLTINDELIDDDFVTFTKSYIKYVKKKGANFVFSFSPVNRLCVNEKSNYQSLEKRIKEEIKCDLLGSISDFIYDEAYFYDTNYHLNDVGQLMHSKRLCELLSEKFSLDNKWSLEIPEPPILNDNQGDNGELDCFNITKIGNQVTITSIKEEYRLTLKEIKIPEVLNDLTINCIGTNAFDGCVNLEKITLPSSITIIEMDAFKGCTSLKELYLEGKNPPLISIDLFDGVRSDFKVYVPTKSLSAYKSNYNWMPYAKMIFGY